MELKFDRSHGLLHHPDLARALVVGEAWTDLLSKAGSSGPLATSSSLSAYLIKIWGRLAAESGECAVYGYSRPRLSTATVTWANRKPKCM